MKMWIFGVAALAAAMCFGATTEDGVTKERRGALGPNDTVVTDVDTTGIVAARTYTKDEIDRRIATNAPVRSVNGRTGRVILGASDVGALPNNRDDLKASANFRNAVWDVQIRGGGCDTNTVDALANSAVVTNALTVATTNRVALLESSKADRPALPVTAGNLAALTADGNLADSGKTVDDFMPRVSNGPVYSTFDIYGPLFMDMDGYIRLGVAGFIYGPFDQIREEMGSKISLRTELDSKADRSMISATNTTFLNEVATVARTVTPPPSPTLRLFDEVRQCYWIGRMVNGVINWEVE